MVISLRVLFLSSARSAKAPASKFIEKKDNTYVTEHVVGIAKDVPEEIKQGLRENFNGECSEVGMYLAMSRC